MEWISVKDRLPEEGVEVLTIDTSYEPPEYRVDYIIKLQNSNEQWIWARETSSVKTITHWISLPEPPKE